mgnify:CR=1 FL=1
MIKKNLIYIIIIGIVALTLIWLSQSSKNQVPELKSLLDDKKIENSTIAKKSNNMLEGVLWSSDDDTKGNFMLVTGNKTIYIKTSRKFNELAGKNVIVSIDGTPDNFTLLNIEENLTKDGYIKVQ